MIAALRLRSAAWMDRTRRAFVARLPETLFVVALISGWGLTGWGAGLILGRWVSPVGVWAMVAGLFLLSCCGWKMLLALARHGLYSLSKAEP